MKQHGTPIGQVSIRTAEFGIRGHRNKIAAYAQEQQTPIVVASIEHSKTQIAKYEAAKAARIAEGAK